MNKPFSIKDKWYLLLLAIPVIAFFILTIAYSQNIPYNDDYPSILEFLKSYQDSNGISEKLSLLFAPYGEHRIFFVRLASLIQLWVAGHVNFAVLPFWGNVGLLVSVVFLLKSSKVPPENRWLYLLPAPFFFFQLQSWSNNVWSMASLSNSLIFGWIVLALYFMFKEGKRAFVIGLLFSLLATYTNGNGVFVLFCAGVTFLLQKSFKKGAISLGLFLLLFILNTHGASQSIVHKIAEQGVPKIAGMFLVFLGSNFFHPSYISVAIAVGVFFCLFFAFLLFAKKYYAMNPVFFSMFLLVFLTGFAIATQRDILDVSTAAPSRYRVYGSYLIMLTFIAIIEVFPRQNFKKLVMFAALPISILFFVACNYVGLAKLKNRYALNLSNEFLLQNKLPVDGYKDSVYEMSLARGFMVTTPIDPALLIAKIDGEKRTAPPQAAPVYHTDTIITGDKYVFIKGWAGEDDQENSLNKPFAIGYTGGHKQVYKANFLEVPSFINDKEKIRFATCGYFLVVPAVEHSSMDSLTIAISRDIKNETLIPIYTIK